MGTPRARRGERPVLTLTDPQAFKALAHPARQVLMNELMAGRVVTATEAADLVGLSPSAVSHHLRALERYGIAERAEPTPGADARTRPWRSAYRDLTLSADSDTAGEAIGLLAHRHFETLVADLIASARSTAADPTSRRSGFSVVETWLTDTERQEVLDRFQELYDSIPTRHSTDHPPDATPISFTVAHVPIVRR